MAFWEDEIQVKDANGSEYLLKRKVPLVPEANRGSGQVAQLPDAEYVLGNGEVVDRLTATTYSVRATGVELTQA